MQNLPTVRPETPADALVRHVATQGPTLDSLSHEDLQAVGKVAVLNSLSKDFQDRVSLAKINYQAEKEIYLEHASRTKSENTRRAYRKALRLLEFWAAYTDLSVLKLTPKEADDYIYWLQSNESRSSSASINLDVSGASAFFTWLSRRHTTIVNPFRGTRARPPMAPVRSCEFPSPEELEVIMAAATKSDLKGAIAVMGLRGLRVGALPSLTIRAGRYQARSKGKVASGVMPPRVLDILRDLGLPLAAPFDGLSEVNLASRFRTLTTKLFKAGKIRAIYSVHDLRHTFAVTNYQETKDIYAIKEFLGHASISVTEFYLKGMNLL